MNQTRRALLARLATLASAAQHLAAESSTLPRHELRERLLTIGEDVERIRYGLEARFTADDADSQRFYTGPMAYTTSER